MQHKANEKNRNTRNTDDIMRRRHIESIDSGTAFTEEELDWEEEDGAFAFFVHTSCMSPEGWASGHGWGDDDLDRIY